MNAIVTNLVRVGAAALVAFLVAMAARIGLPQLTSAEQQLVTGAIVTVAVPAVLWVVAKLEKRFPSVTHVLPVKGLPAPAARPEP